MKSIKISDSTYKAIKNESKKRGCFLSKVLDDALIAYFKGQLFGFGKGKGK